jgi:hypothetical protein
MTTDNFCFYLQNRLIQTSQTGGRQYSDTSPFSIPCTECQSGLIESTKTTQNDTLGPPGNTYNKEKVSTIDLLIKVTSCIIKK